MREDVEGALRVWRDAVEAAALVPEVGLAEEAMRLARPRGEGWALMCAWLVFLGLSVSAWVSAVEVEHVRAMLAM